MAAACGPNPQLPTPGIIVLAWRKTIRVIISRDGTVLIGLGSGLGFPRQGNRTIWSRNRRCYAQDFQQVAAIPTCSQPLGLNASFQCCFLL